MAGYIKNQILKHLSKYAKNLTPDQISVDVLKGNGELQNIILNEELLTEVLELPTWLKINKAVCNRISVQVPWTRLKTSPIQLYIDEINVEVVFSSDLRTSGMPSASSMSTLSAYANADNTYGFVNRVAEGMSIYINTLEMFFSSEMFGGSLMLSRLSVESCTPNWSKATDLRHTRIRDAKTDQVVIYKRVDWQLLRIEASSIKGKNAATSPTGYTISAPLRLITSQGRGRIAFKKSTLDGSVLSGRIQVILDDILWVATLAQIRSALSFYRHMIELVTKAADRHKAQLAKQRQKATTPALSPTQGAFATMNSPGSTTTIGFSYPQYDVKATSYHFYVGKIDLHLCDDTNHKIDYPPDWNIQNGAIQVTLTKFACDIYPYHKSAGERSYWVRYKDRNQFKDWITKLLSHYESAIVAKLDKTGKELFRRTLWPSLTSQCCVMRIDDISVYCVSEATTKRDTLGLLLSSSREAFSLPSDQPLFHAEFSDFYYASSSSDIEQQSVPVPPACSHILLNPVKCAVDYKTVRWLNYVYQQVIKALQLSLDDVSSIPHSDVRIEAMLPTIVLLNGDEGLADAKEPSEMTIQISSCLLTNCAQIGCEDVVAADSLKTVVQSLGDRHLFQSGGRFDLESQLFDFLPCETSAFRQYVTDLCEMVAASSTYFKRSPKKSLSSNMCEELDSSSSSAANDIWLTSLSPLWVEFGGSELYYPKPMPLVFDTPLQCWFIGNSAAPIIEAGAESSPSPEAALGKPAHFYLILQSLSPIRVVLDHYHYLFLMRSLDRLFLFADTIEADERWFSPVVESPKTLVVTSILDSIDVTLLLPCDPPLSPYANRRSDSTTNSMMRLQNCLDPNEHGTRTSSSSISATQPYNNSPVTAEKNPKRKSPPVTSARPVRTAPDVPTVVFPEFPVNLKDSVSFRTGGSDSPSLLSAAGDDAISIATDISDDDQFVLLDEQNCASAAAPFDDVFPEELQGRIAMAEEALEPDDISDELNKTPRSNAATMINMVMNEKCSALKIAVRDVELAVLSSSASGSHVDVQCSAVDIAELLNTTLREAHQFASIGDGGDEAEKIGDDVLKPVRILLRSKTAAGVDEKGNLKEGQTKQQLLEVLVNKLQVELNSTVVSNVVEFVDDESQDAGAPTIIRVTDVQLSVKEDGKPAGDMVVDVKDSVVTKGAVSTIEPRLTAKIDAADQIETLKSENQQLRRRLLETRDLIQKMAKAAVKQPNNLDGAVTK